MQEQVEPSDDALMEKFCAGDEASFNELYARHATAVSSFLRGMVRRPDLAEDLLQATFISMVRSRDRYEKGSSLRSWLITIAANAARDSMRRDRVRTSAASVLREESATSTEHAASDPIMGQALQAALDELPAGEREAVLLHKVQDLPFPEVAQVLGISVGAAKVRAHRGYQRLRHRLSSLKEQP